MDTDGQEKIFTMITKTGGRNTMYGPVKNKDIFGYGFKGRGY